VSSVTTTVADIYRYVGGVDMAYAHGLSDAMVAMDDGRNPFDSRTPDIAARRGAG